MFRSCLARQITEVETLQAMYSGVNEMTLWNQVEFENLKTAVKARGMSQDGELPRVAFQLQLPLGGPYPESSSLIFQVTLPAFYPSSDNAIAHINFDLLTPKQEAVLRDSVTAFIESKLGQECVLDLVQYAKDWVFDNVPVPAPKTTTATSTSTSVVASTATVSKPSVQSSKGVQPAANSNAPVLSAKAPPQAAKAKASPKAKPPIPPAKEQEFRRILIWFSTVAPDRAKTVAEWAKQLGLTGISRLGSPAMIVVEGLKEDVDEYVSSLRSYRWKKMDIVWEDKSKSTNINSCRRFQNFQDCMMPLPELQAIFKKANLEDMFREGLKIRG